MTSVRAVLDVSNASRSWGTRLALDRVSLSIDPGQIFALIGANGAGKTTLVRTITGRASLDAGDIYICGERVGDGERYRRLLGLVPQSIALYRHLTARENLETFGRLAGVSTAELSRSVDHALDRVGLTDRANDVTASLSGGMQRRLNIAAGTLHRPKLLLLDEPTVGIDVAAREAIHELLRELRRAGMAVLLATHDLDEAAELGDRVGVLSHGRLAATGTPADLIADTFADARELCVAVTKVPHERARALFEARGLRRTNGGRIWSGRLEGDLDSVSELSRALAAMGVHVGEIRVREPSLRSVFFQLTGEEITS